MTKFETLNLDDLQQEDNRLNESGNKNGFLDQFVPMPEVAPGKKGTVVVRILPPLAGQKLFQYNRTHRVNGRSNPCPRNLVKGKWDKSTPCPVCDYYNSLWRDADKADKAGDLKQKEALVEEARSLKPVERYYYNAIVRQYTDENGAVHNNVGPRILSIGKTLHKKIIRAIMGDPDDPHSQLSDVTNIEKGYDFIIRKEVTPGENNYPKYDATEFARESSPAGTAEEVAKWVEGSIDLTKLRNPKSVEELEREIGIHRGVIADEDPQGFNKEAFDERMAAKYSGSVSSEMSEAKVTEVVSNSTTETTTEPVTAQSEAPAAETPAEAEQNVVIEDEDFLKELEGMG